MRSHDMHIPSQPIYNSHVSLLQAIVFLVVVVVVVLAFITIHGFIDSICVESPVESV